MNTFILQGGINLLSCNMTGRKNACEISNKSITFTQDTFVKLLKYRFSSHLVFSIIQANASFLGEYKRIEL